MNVLHISESDAAGGAGRAAYRLHHGLRSLGHGSHMLVGRKVTADADTRSIKRTPVWRVLDRACGAALDRVGLQYVAYPSSFAAVRDPWFRQADILQLHNLHGSYFGFAALPLLTRRRPAVWQLHDQWALTGHVAYSLDCERWRTGCGSCPYLDEYPRLRRDTTALLWRLKRAVYARSRFALVVPSRWLAQMVEASPLLSRFPVRQIATGVDTALFSPGSREDARRRLGLPLERKLVLFAASDLHEPRKGLRLLVEALRLIDDPPLLVLAGTGAPPPGVEAQALGELADEALADAYRAADACAVPTVADVQTQTAPESLACGTPCLSFDRGGVTEVVRHLETGYQSRFGDVADLARGLEALLAQDGGLAERCRQVAEREYAVDVQVRRYVELYEELVAA